MCGRFWIPREAVDQVVALLPDDQQEAARKAIKEWVEYMNAQRGTHDVRPTNRVPVITSTGFQAMRWGFRTDKSNAVFNARVESMRYPMWRESLVMRRAVIPAGGFYEWTGTKGSKQAHAIERADHEVMLFGALWSPDDELGPCVSIITTPSTEWMTPLHDRMPMILEREQVAEWLDLTSKPPQIKAMIEPYAGKLEEFACASPSRDVPPKPDKGLLF
ncbi:MAG: SOS response-associated peptidase [Planctomycetes bacterium]|nr:SOS response-associated peptidase [Planctomycetota bacterium]